MQIAKNIRYLCNRFEQNKIHFSKLTTSIVSIIFLLLKYMRLTDESHRFLFVKGRLWKKHLIMICI